MAAAKNKNYWSRFESNLREMASQIGTYFFLSFQNENQRIREAIAEITGYIRWVKVGSAMSGKPAVTKDSKMFLEYLWKHWFIQVNLGYDYLCEAPI